MGYVFLRVTSPNVPVEDSKHLFPGNRPKTNHPPVVAFLAQGRREPRRLDLTKYHIRATVPLWAQVQDVDPEALVLGGPDRELVGPRRTPVRVRRGGRELRSTRGAVRDHQPRLPPGPCHACE